MQCTDIVLITVYVLTCFNLYVGFKVYFEYRHCTLSYNTYTTSIITE